MAKEKHDEDEEDSFDDSDSDEFEDDDLVEEDKSKGTYDDEEW